MFFRSCAVALVAALTLACARASPPQTSWLGAPTAVAPGVDLFQATDPSLIDPSGPIAVFLLRLDPARARLASVLSNDAVVDAERVDTIAARHRAIAAVNGGFFNVKNGEPTGLLKVAGELVSDSTLARAAVVIRSPPQGRTELQFDQISARAMLAFKRAGHDRAVPIAGVDTTRGRGKLMLYTAAYHGHTDTASNGIEWVLEGRPLRVTAVHVNTGRTPIPREGAVLSYGGLDLPEPLDELIVGVPATISVEWTAKNGLPAKALDEADHIINGAGLLRLNGSTPTNWQTSERLVPETFIDARHPRTLIGVDRHGFIWLAAIDGRQPDHSVGMAFADLLRLCDRLELKDALNLDGGGSTTMVVQGKIVNKPSDAAGPRAVSDAIVVTVR